MDYCVYILFSPKYGHYYIGQTNNLERRLVQHNESKCGWTKKFRPWSIVYKKKYHERGKAIKAEKYLKSLKNKKNIEIFVVNYYRGVEE